jgi:SAM-dependent methyltransferase
MAAVKARDFRAFVTAADVVLDFGCASGEVLLELPGHRRLGVEPNATFRELAQAKGVEVFPRLGDVPDDAVNVAISGHALEHTTRPLDNLRDIWRVLRADGRLVLVLPLDDWRVQRNFKAPDLNHHLYAWTPLLLGNLLGEAGFDVERIDVMTHAWPPRGAYLLWRLFPHWLFDAVCVACSVVLRRRQILAIARANKDHQKVSISY